MATNPSPLKERDYIQESKRPMFPYWLGGLVVIAIAFSIWLGLSWVTDQMDLKFVNNPFLQVTNRDFSLFLWQHPEHMRATTKNRSGYLPGFKLEQTIALKSEYANKYVQAPPEVIFLYHTWNRLLSEYYFDRAIPALEFGEFIETVPDWNPNTWLEAPEGYKAFVAGYNFTTTEDLSKLSEEEIPRVVRRAFIGWRNFLYEGKEINQTRPTYEELDTFIREHPNFARNFWRNIDSKYLTNYTFGKDEKSAMVPSDDIAPFLRVAFFNYQQAKREHS